MFLRNISTKKLILHGKFFVPYLPTRCFCIRNLTRSLRSLVRFLIRQQLLCKYRTPALSMKYSLYLMSKFKKRNEWKYSLKDSVNKLVVPFPRTSHMKNSFSYSGATLWNGLPCNIRECSSFNQFKLLLYQGFLSGILLGLGFLGFRMLVIVLEFIVRDEFFIVYK